MHQILIDSTVAVTERVRPEWIHLQLTGQTVVGLFKISMASDKETHLQQHFNALIEMERKADVSTLSYTAYTCIESEKRSLCMCWFTQGLTLKKLR